MNQEKKTYQQRSQATKEYISIFQDKWRARDKFDHFVVVFYYGVEKVEINLSAVFRINFGFHERLRQKNKKYN
jgi:hypothetical protein